jgi:mannose-1-phosphate guanylyltransferase / phosphomannomutase
MQAVIMAGGEGSRLRPLTSNVPKPMLPVANRPLMEHIIELLRNHGITDIVATVQFLSSVIRNYFGDGSDLGVSLSYATEDVPLGTAGSVVGAQDLLNGTFVVVSGDALTDVNLTDVLEFHRAKGAAATLVLKRMSDPLEFGIVMTDDEGRIERFLEKPTWGQVFSDTINTGIYVLEPDIFDLVPPDQPYDFSSELFPMMLDKGLPLFGYITDAYWTDVGNSDAYLQAQHDALSGKVQISMPGFELRPSVWVGEDVEIDPTARLEGPLLIGDNSQIGPGARVGPSAVVGQNSFIGDDAVVSNGVLMERSRVSAYARVTGGVLGRGATLDRGATLEEGAVLGDEVTVGAGALIKSRVRVYPSKTVEAGAIVTQSIVRERRAARSLFGTRGVSGLVNVGITPMTAVRLGMAYGTTLKRGSVVVTGRDGSRAARTLKRALIAGLNSTGVTCHDLELTPMPLTRFTVRSEQASGGVSVRTSPGDAETVEIRLFDGDGADLPEADQRKIERIFFREDYRRAGPTKLGELEFPARTLEQYTSGLLRALDVEAIRSRAPKVVVDYAYGPASTIGPSVLGRLGCDTLSVNAFVDEHRPVLTSGDLDRLLEGLSDHVRNSGSDLGVLLEPGGEVAHLVDDAGRVLSPERTLLAFLKHEAGRSAGGTVAVPVSCSWACDDLAAAAGASLLRTTTGLPSLMARAQRSDVTFAGNSDGVLIFPALMPAPDGLMTFCKALEMLATSAETGFARIVDGLPEVNMVTRDVRTPWELKGAVMRHVASVAAPGKLVLVDGVKIVENDRWALVIPAPDEPLCRIWAEGPTMADAEELADRYARIVEGVVAEGQEATS